MIICSRGINTKKNKKMVIPIIFVLIFTITNISGCLSLANFPISTWSPIVHYDNSSWVQLAGEIGVSFCKSDNHMFVYDTESHKNWSDYAFRRNNTFFRVFAFFDELNSSEITHGVTYYVRAVAYCYDFEKPFQDYKERYYQGDEKTFIVN
jgi:hypothetical protein